jgi:2-oxoglutarate ferredoxin oxidoreductase subunit alpha
VLCPLPRRALQDWLAQLDGLLVVELNHGAQFWRYLRSELDLPAPAHSYARAGGRALEVQELLAALAQLSATAAS